MTLELLTQFFAWFTLLNFAVLLFSWLLFIPLKGFVMQIHSASLGIEQSELPRLYFQFFAIYKVLILTFGLVPYLVLRLVM